MNARPPLYFLRRALTALPLTLLLLIPAAPASAAFSDWWPFGRKEAAEPVPDPVEYTVTLTVTGDAHDLEKPLRAASGLFEKKDTPPSGMAGLIARSRQDLPRLAAVLYEHARYAGEIAITVGGKPLESMGPFDPVEARPVPVAITIDPGPAFRFGRIVAEPMPAGVSLQRIGLVTGRPAVSTTIVRAETAMLEAWREHGHPLAATKPRAVVADHATSTLDVELQVVPGPVAKFGRVTVTVGSETGKGVDRDLIIGRAGIEHGEFSAKTIKRATTRLRDLGVFDSVRVTAAEKLDPDGTIPVDIAVSERKPHVIGGSVSYSNTEGAGIEGVWRHRNLFGGAEQLQVSASISRLITQSDNPDYRLGTTFKKPGVLDPMTDATLRVEAYRQTTDAYRVTAFEQEAGLARIFSDTLSGSLGIALARSRTVDDTGKTENHLLATIPGKIDWDARDFKLDPTKGFRNQFLLAPAHDFHNGANFVTLGADASAYRAFGVDERIVVAARAAAISLAARDVQDVAVDRRIYAGGAGSVRGYGYKNIAPRDSEGKLIGGRSSLILSGEVRYRLNDQFGIVAFADAGNSIESITPLPREMKVGIGAGVRYLTPVGPIRFDIAVPLQRGIDDPRVGIYVGLGQAF